MGNIHDNTIYYVTEDGVREVLIGVKREISVNDIEKVIINEPATVILWKDGSKTVVKCGKSDLIDYEKGIAMAIVKHILFKDKSTPMNKWFEAQIEQNEREYE